MADVEQAQEELKKKPRDLTAFLNLAKERFKLAADAEAAVRKEALDDLKFSVGKGQWPADIAQRRQEEGKPAMTMNRIPQFIHMITNEQRQQRPAVQVNPVGDGASKDTAEILQGMIRHIETQSDAEIAYDTAFDAMVRTGFGYFRIVTEYIDPNDPDNLDQEIKIKRVKNQFRVYVDPSCNEPDYSDAKYWFIIEPMTPAEYKNKYPKSDLASLEDFSSMGDQDKDWVNDDSVRVAEYFYVEEDWTEVKKNGRLKRIKKRAVKWAKINAIEILEETTSPGQFVGIIPVLGTDLDIEGDRYLAGAVRDAKEPQRAYNYGVSTAWETAGIAPRAPYLADVESVADFKEMWEQANRRNFGVLYYDSKGNTLPKPDRNVAEPPLQAFALLVRQADNDLKSSIGIYDASLGQKGPDESGKAVLARQRQGDLATLNYSDNLSRSIRHLGRVLVDLIPHIYDAPRVQRIVNPDHSIDHVGIFNSKKSGMTMDDVKALAEMQAVKKIYDVGVGRYDVTVSVGPSYQSKRQEAVASIMALVNAYPALMQAAGDLLVRNMDWPGADEIAKRLQKLLPPALQPDGDEPEIVAQKAQAQLAQLMQQHTVVVAELQKAQQIIQAKQVESQTKLQIAELNAKVQLLVQEAKTQGEGALMKLDAELQHIRTGLDQMFQQQQMDQQAQQEVPENPPAVA